MRNLISQIQRIRHEGSFMRNVSIASFWNITIMIVQFSLSPIISRLYSPGEYGVYVLFSSIVINITFFSHLKYGEAVILTKSTLQRQTMFTVSALLLLAFTGLSFLAVFLFKQPVSKLLTLSETSHLVYLIPVGVLLSGSIELLQNVNVGRKKFSINGFSGFLNGAMSRGFNIAYALYTRANASGLIFGDLIGKACALISLLFSFRNPFQLARQLRTSLNRKRMALAAYRFKNFPLYFLPSNFLIGFSAHIPLYAFQVQFGSDVVGAYALASSLLEIFNRLVPYTISTVFLQKAIELKSVSVKILSERVYKLFEYMLLLGVIIFSGCALFGRIVFPWVFGQRWEVAGAIIAILAVHYAFNFVSVSLSEVYKVMGRQRLLLATSILTIVMKVVSLGVVFMLKTEVLMSVFIYSIASSIGNMVQIVGIFVILNFRIPRIFLFLFLALITLLGTLAIGNAF